MLLLLVMKALNPKMTPLKDLDSLLARPAIKTSTLMKQQRSVQRLHLAMVQFTQCLHFRNVFLANIQMLQVLQRLGKLIASLALKELFVAVQQHPLLALLVQMGTGVQLWMRTDPNYGNIHVLQEPKP